MATHHLARLDDAVPVAFRVAVSPATDALAPLSLRFGLAFVFVTFGVEKIIAWRGWAVLVPGELLTLLERATGLGAATLVQLLGYGEVVLGVHLALGFCTRSAALGCVTVLAAAVLVMGMTGIGIRDAGLAAAALAVALQGGGAWSLDAAFKARADTRVRS